MTDINELIERLENEDEYGLFQEAATALRELQKKRDELHQKLEDQKNAVSIMEVRHHDQFERAEAAEARVKELEASFRNLHVSFENRTEHWRDTIRQRDQWKNVAKNSGVCMSCALGAPEPYGCTDCLNTGWNNGAPTGFVPAEEKP